MFFLMAAFLFSSPLDWEHGSWLKEAENRVDEEVVAWLRKQINPNESKQELVLPEACKNCFKGKIVEIEDPKIYVCMSFSAPDNIWLSLDKEMEDCQAVFVLRGLPNNSFEVLASRLVALKGKGMSASVMIYHQIFKDYLVERVPTFIFKEYLVEDQISGTISLHYAREIVKRK
jgi:type-F conjugative transfer system pilin assembly protein TrbC